MLFVPINALTPSEIAGLGVNVMLAAQQQANQQRRPRRVRWRDAVGQAAHRHRRRRPSAPLAI